MSSEPSKIKIRQVPNLSVRSHAENFHEAASLLYEEGTTVAPVIVNAAFALELYLKSLNSDIEWPSQADLDAQVYLYGIVTDQPKERGHNLSELFCALPVDLQDYLSKQYATSPLVVTKSSLVEAVASFDNVFETWRYMYEGKAESVEVGFLLELLSFMDAVTLELIRSDGT